MKKELINRIKGYLEDKYKVDLSSTKFDTSITLNFDSYLGVPNYRLNTDVVNVPKINIPQLLPSALWTSTAMISPSAFPIIAGGYLSLITILSYLISPSNMSHEFTHAVIRRIHKSPYADFNESLAIHEEYKNTNIPFISRVATKGMHCLFPFNYFQEYQYKDWFKLFNLIDLNKDERHQKLKRIHLPNSQLDLCDRLIELTPREMVLTHKEIKQELKYIVGYL